MPVPGRGSGSNDISGIRLGRGPSVHLDAPTYFVLGPVAATDDAGGHLDLGGAQRRAVLAQLVLGAGRVVSVDALGEGLWADRWPPTAVKAIQVHVSQLRRVLPPGHLRTRPPGYLLDVPGDASDMVRFESEVERARRDLVAGRREPAARLLRSALAMWRGPALADVADFPFAAAAVARLEEGRHQALEDRIAADLALGRHASLVGELEGLVRAEPLRERLWAHLMTALYRCERQADALEAFSRARRHLVAEFGLEPGPELRRLEREVLNQTLTTGAAVAVTLALDRPAVSQPSSALRLSGPVVGRDAALTRLRDALDEVVTSGSGAIAAVRGGEGLGKTSLIAAFAASVAGRATVLDGRCREHVALPFGPWSEILRQMGAEAELDLLEGETHPPEETPERRRTRFFEGVVSRLREQSRDHPVVAVLDDLHWSDDASVTLLLYAVGELTSSAVLFVLAWRDREIAVGHPVTRLVHHLARHRALVLDLAPLGTVDIGDLLAISDFSDDASRLREIASVIHSVTSGVPLFVADVVAKLQAVYDELPAAADLAAGVPETVRAMVAHRLTIAGRPAGAVAEACAILSDPFRPSVVRAVLPRMEAVELLEALDNLVDAGLIHEEADGYVFEHGTFRRAIDEATLAGRRQMLHAAAYRALEHEPVPPAVLVHHSESAGPLVATADTLRQLLRAGTDATERGAFVDAAEFLGRAAELSDEGSRPAVLVAHADALWRGGDVTAAKAVAAKVVASAGDGSVSDRALTDAVVLHGTFGARFGPDSASIAATERALAIVSDPEQQARLRIALAYHHAMWGSPAAVAVSAVARAKASLPAACPAELLGDAIFAESLVLMGTADLTRRRRLADDLVELGRRTGSQRALGRALRIRSLAEMSAGRLRDLLATLDELGHVAERTGSWTYRSDAARWRMAAALAAGDDGQAAAGLEELERIIASPLGGRAPVAAERLLLHWSRGELDSCLAILDALRGEVPPDRTRASDRQLIDLFRLVVLVAQGRADEARDEFLLSAAPGDLDQASCRRYPAELALTAALTASFGMADGADALIDRLEPFSGQLIVLPWGEGILGAADRFLAQLQSLVSGRVDDASFLKAVALEEGSGAIAAAERTRVAWKRASAEMTTELAL